MGKPRRARPTRRDFHQSERAAPGRHRARWIQYRSTRSCSRGSMTVDSYSPPLARITRRLASALSLTVDDIMDTAGLPLIGLVPEDPNVTLAAAFKKDLLSYRRKDAAKACCRIARRIQGYTTPIFL